MPKDNINPSYYQKGICSCGKQLSTYDFVKDLAYSQGSAIKYLVRYKEKHGVEDVQKSMWFLIALLIKEYGMTAKEVISFIQDLLVKEYGK
jgi:hypothetical protein